MVWRVGVSLLVVIVMCFPVGCTRITAKIPGGVDFEYSTTDSKELSGLTIVKTSTGWKAVLDKSKSDTNAAILELIKKWPVK